MFYGFSDLLKLLINLKYNLYIKPHKHFFKFHQIHIKFIFLSSGAETRYTFDICILRASIFNVYFALNFSARDRGPETWTEFNEFELGG